MRYYLIFAMLLCGRLHAAIAVAAGPVLANAAGGVFNASSGTITFTTAASCTNCVLVVPLGANGTNNQFISVSFAGQALTRYRRDTFSGASSSFFSNEMWYLVNPPTSTSGNITFTASSSNLLAGGAIEYSGVDQANPFRSGNASAATGASNTTTLTTQSANSWLAVNYIGYPYVTVTLDSLLTSRFTTSSAGNSWDFYGDRTTTAAGAYSVTSSNTGANLGEVQQVDELQVPQPTFTSTITSTFTFTSTVTKTNTPTPTSTITPTFTSTATPTSTITPTFTSTSTITPTFTFTSTATPTSTITQTFTFTSTSTPTFTITPSATPTNTPTNTPTPTCTNTPTPTITPTSSNTPTCNNYGSTDSTGSYYAFNGTLFYKMITLTSTANLQDVYVYVASGQGQIKAAVYDSYNNAPRSILCQSATFYSTPGWNDLSISASALPAGTYWIGTQASGDATLLYSRVGIDKFQYNQYGDWPSPAHWQYYLGNASIYSRDCE